jgi:hypothetical protein
MPRKLTDYEKRVLASVTLHPGERAEAYHRWLYLPPLRPGQLAHVVQCLDRLVKLGRIRVTENTTTPRYTPK